MAKIASQLTELIGNTPLLELTNYEKELGLKAHIVAKLEYFNPLGSVKDRVAAAMIEQNKGWPHQSGYSHHRAYIRKYRNRTCICISGKGTSPDTHHAGHHER